MSHLDRPHHHDSLHERIERLVGADIRLVYGTLVPMLAVVGFIVALAISGQSWLIVGVVVFLLIAVAVVVMGVMGMIGEDDDT